MSISPYIQLPLGQLPSLTKELDQFQFVEMMIDINCFLVNEKFYKVFAVFCDKMADEYSEKLKVRFWCNTRMVLQIVNLTGRTKEWKKYLRMVNISHYWQFSALLDGHWRIPL